MVTELLALIRARLPSVVSAKGDRDMVSEVYVEIELAASAELLGSLIEIISTI